MRVVGKRSGREAWQDALREVPKLRGTGSKGVGMFSNGINVDRTKSCW